MGLPDNFSSLHKHEEEIRVTSLKLLAETPNLNDHIFMIHGAMALIHALAHDHVNATDDELTIQYLGLRLFNSAASSLKLAQAGYYQSAFTMTRDIFETVALLDYFESNPAKIAVWKASDKNQRISEFGPAAIRKALDQRDQFSEKKRKQTYDRLSEYASHATAPGFLLLAPDGLGKIGPFFNERYLTAWVEEIVKFLAHGALIFMSFFGNVEPTLLLEKAEFLNQVESWQKKYLGAGEAAT